MGRSDLPRDAHRRLRPTDDARQRGATQAGGEDSHAERRHAELPAYDPAFRPTNLGPKIDRQIHDDKPRHRTQTLFPFLIIRAVPGDHGARPLWPPIVCWESCDIHIQPAGPGGFDFSRTVLQPVVGQAYRVFVHVWNLGRFAAYGGRVRAWWVDPGFFSGTPGPFYQPHFIGGSYFDLGDRDSGQAHRIVEVGQWTVVPNNDAHECLIAVVDSAVDPWDGVMNSNTHRHVAQRNLNLIAGPANARALIQGLGSKMRTHDRQLLVTAAPVIRAGFLGARGAGMATSGEPPAGWDHSGITGGSDERAIGAIRTGPDGNHYWNLFPQATLTPNVVLPPMPSLAGSFRVGELGKVLGNLVQKSLRVKSLTGRNVAARLGGSSILRFTLTDAEGTNMGYSIVFVP